MGRGGGHGGGGGGHHSSGGFRSSGGGGGSHRSSSGFSRSSINRSSRPSGSYHNNYSYGRGYHNTYVYAPGGRYRRPYRSNAGGIGCLSFIILMLVVFIIMGVISSGKSSEGVSFSQIDEQVVAAEAEKYYNKELKQADNAMLLYITNSKKLDDEYPYVWYGDKAGRFVQKNLDRFWSIYDSHYDDDLGYQLDYTLTEFAAALKGSDEKIPEIPFKGSFKDIAEDNLGWVDSPERVEKGAKALYDATNVQFYVVTVNYDKIPSVVKAQEEKSAKIRNVLLVVVVISVGIIAFVVIKGNRDKKKAEEQKKLEEEIKIINTPLDEMAGTAGGSVVDDLLKKYDSDEKTPVK
ncbi:MAG: hypothetical protein PUB67_05660 [Clostridiales bacterium]|nr:hypothetical protein [Clostridiales bacterium]